MGAESLKTGDKVELSDGAVAEVTGTLSNGGVPIRIIDSPFGSDQPGADKIADPDEIFGVFIDDAMSEVRAL
jgi:hypothetical protein